MRDVPGRRKVLFFVGSGLAIGGTFEWGGQVRPCRDEMLRELAVSNVTVQTIDPVGLLTAEPDAAYTSPARMSPSLVLGWARQNQVRIDELRVLPDRTGGRLVANTNTPQKYVPAIFAETQMYYLLGIEPVPGAAPGTDHRISVQVHRRGATVHARSAYVTGTAPAVPAASGPKPLTPAEVARAKDAATSALLDGALPRNDLPLSIAAAPFAVPSSRDAAVAVVLGAVLPPASGPRHVDVTVGAFDIRGNSVAVTNETLEVSPAVAGRPEADEGLLARLNLPTGRYEVRAAVEDRVSGVTGTVFSFVDVPAFGRRELTASGVLLHRARPAAMPDDPLRDLLPFVPTVARTFQPAEDVRAFVRLYQPVPGEPAAVRTRVLDTRGSVAFDRRTNLDADAFATGSADVDLPLPLATLAPGDYLLRIEATAGETQVDRDVRFTVSR